jgi:hypothetical protein
MKTLRCPGCFANEELHRSHLRWWDIPLRLLGMRPYRCLSCNRRFYAWKHTAAHERGAAGTQVDRG